MKHEKRKILHVVTNLSDGGLEKVVYLIIKHLDNSEFEHTVAVLTRNENDFLVERFKDLGVEVVPFDFDNRFLSYKSILKNIPQLSKLVNLIRRKKIHVVHSHDVFPAFVARLAYLFSVFMFFKPKRVIVTLHNIYFWLSPVHHFVNKILSILTYRIVCVSNAVMDYSIINDKIKRSKYQVIFNGVESEAYSPDPQCIKKYYTEFGYKANNFIIGNVGVLSVRKGQKYLIKAFDLFVKKVPEARLMIIGSERSHEKEIANEIYELIKMRELEKYIKIVPPRVDINKIYNVFDIYAMPSVSEGQSLSAIEAMLNSRICLFSDIAPFKEMITVGQNGFLFRSEDIEDIFYKLQYIYDNYSKLNIVGKNAREEALCKYNVVNMSNSYGLLYSI
ncbi:MAG TPA: glycosyltransferase [Ignavibacteria bacterium]|nr:glycosyltransferase [Ignavibacteria bacterium]HMQ98048.1 glycosyltransferase [Ignavibacteria bacterium]